MEFWDLVERNHKGEGLTEDILKVITNIYIRYSKIHLNVY